MKTTIVKLGTLFLLATAYPSPAKAQQVVYSSYPVFSNGYVVDIPASTAAPTTTYYPGGVGASVYPSPKATLSGNTFVDGGPNVYRTLYYPPTSPRNPINPFGLFGSQQSTFNPILGSSVANPFQTAPLGTVGSAMQGRPQLPPLGLGFPLSRQ